MQTKHGNEEASDRLKQALGKWEVNAALPPRFQEGVWSRIARKEKRLESTFWPALASWVASAISRPVIAGAYVSVLLLAGLGAGYWRAQTDNTRTVQELGTRYVQMMDPYQMPRH